MTLNPRYQQQLRTKHSRRQPVACLACWGMVICFLGWQPEASAQDLPPIPELAREYRGVWVATVANIDWPSKPGLSSQEQQRQAIAILDQISAMRMNVVVLQVRTSCDALYASPHEPWSYYLTGTQGQPPEPMYDPLEFWLQQAHQRGLELHAWFNPFRAKNSGQRYEDCQQHISQTRPELVKRYGNETTSYLWLDPGESDARQHSLKVFLDVLQRYDVDGIHIDDYFYPYPVDELPFPDDPAWNRYRESQGELERDDWRRHNMNAFIEKLYAAIKQLKPHVKFGISPFGIWKPGYPSSVAGFSQYDRLYADAKMWWNQGWCDYYTPQLYWSITAPQQSFPALLAWWSAENTQGRHLAPGLYTGRIGNPSRSFSPEQIESQVFVARHMPGSSGTIHFSMKSLLENREGIADRLRDNAYQQPAVPPACTWVDNQPPAAPLVSIQETAGGLSAEWKAGCDQTVRRWCLYTLRGSQWQLSIVHGDQSSTDLSNQLDPPVRAVAVRALDQAGNLSPASIQIP